MTAAGEERGAQVLEHALRETFPAVQFSMAYGSGVFAQSNHDASTSLLDLVFAVDDPVAWHEANLARNGHHYSLLKHLGAQGVADFQENYGAGIYYNTLVPLQSKALGTRLIKYGVVSAKMLCADLYDWKTLYLSGRMHKPVGTQDTSIDIAATAVVHFLSSNELIRTASSANLTHALHYALLCLPEKFSEMDLFMRIAGISYLGDFRMTFGENPKKVRNIVDGNFDAFRKLYVNKIKVRAIASIVGDALHAPGIEDPSSFLLYVELAVRVALDLGQQRARGGHFGPQSAPDAARVHAGERVAAHAEEQIVRRHDDRPRGHEEARAARGGVHREPVQPHAEHQGHRDRWRRQDRAVRRAETATDLL